MLLAAEELASELLPPVAKPSLAVAGLASGLLLPAVEELASGLQPLCASTFSDRLAARMLLLAAEKLVRDLPHVAAPVVEGLAFALQLLAGEGFGCKLPPALAAVGLASGLRLLASCELLPPARPSLAAEGLAFELLPVAATLSHAAAEERAFEPALAAAAFASHAPRIGFSLPAAMPNTSPTCFDLRACVERTSCSALV